MEPCLSVRGRKNVGRTGSVKSFQSKMFSEKVRSFSLNIIQFLKWVLEADTASTQYVVPVLKTKIES